MIATLVAAACMPAVWPLLGQGVPEAAKAAVALLGATGGGYIGDFLKDAIDRLRHQDGTPRSQAELQEALEHELLARLQSQDEPLAGHTDSVVDVVFSPDGNTLATTSADHTVRLWPSSIDTWIRHACTLAGRNLRQEEWNQFLPGRPYVRACPDLPSGYGAPADAPAATYRLD